MLKDLEMVQSFEKMRHKVIGINGKFIYHLGVIDYLQAFDCGKKTEAYCKSQVLNRDPQLVSAVSPKIYGTRFFKFMRDKVFVDMKMKAEEAFCDSLLKKSKIFE